MTTGPFQLFQFYWDHIIIRSTVDQFVVWIDAGFCRVAFHTNCQSRLTRFDFVLLNVKRIDPISAVFTFVSGFQHPEKWGWFTSARICRHD